eukprot:TRINITY_DN3206_c0_g1_i1.p2 TRINITY_DN3206_c0_g1~~TRINITY_DN3206_c0_g1_i1.p2  ORF type:complete len:830 (-),score=545.33 TRINITY_DN3206_c0_g1_i1:32-2521(-)
MSDTDDSQVIDTLGLSDKTRASYNKNADLCRRLAAATRLVALDDRKDVAAMLAQIASKVTVDAHVAQLATYVAEKKIDKVRIDAALKFAGAHKKDDKLDLAALDTACGVGVVVSEADITAAVAAALEKQKAEITELRYHFNIGKLFGPVMSSLKWADGGVVRSAAEKQLAALLGPRTAEDDKPRAKSKSKGEPKKKGGGKKGGAVKEAAEAGVTSAADEGHEFPAPSANAAGNTPALLKAHLAVTGGRVMTRFPPEPNGYLHIGHAKAMFLDFGYGAKLGECVLRYDDTNPEAESQEYIDSILDSVHWMGHKPARITYSSDYFHTLHALAIKLIKRGKAYVCHQTGAESSECRRTRTDSPWRDRPIDENLRLFDEMRRGLWAEGEAWLRMKIDMQSDNPCMRDPCAYRIKFHHHPRTGDEWAIYPSYDFTHCLVDSLENITHSLCTLEFDIRRPAYYWLIDALDMYRPLVWEFSRLEFADRVTLPDDDASGAERDWFLYTTLSKRRLLAAVNSGKARGWDDPRMPTLNGLRRRGFTAAAINGLIEAIGVTRAVQRIPFRRLEQQLRVDLDPSAPRRMAVLRPLKLVISNFDDVKLREVTLPNHPLHAERGSRTLPFTRTLFIEASDFREVDSKDFYGLAPGKEVGLRHAGNVTCSEVQRDADGRVVALVGTLDEHKKNKTKGHLHWVPDPELAGGASRRAEVRLYEWLFHVCEPVPEVTNKTKAADVEAAAAAAKAADEARAAKAADNADGHDENDDDGGGAEQRASIESEEVLTDAIVETSVGTTPFTHFQFERVGYFVVDPDTDGERLVLNRATTLKESSAKKGMKK